jgi:acyl-CoA thioesterase
MTADEEFVGLRSGEQPGHSSFVVTRHLVRYDDRIYGGAALAVSLAAMEVTSGRRPLWATTQFVSSALLGHRVDCVTEVLAAGRRTSQLRVTAMSDGEVIFTALGSAVEPRSDGQAGTFERMPTVRAPRTGPPAFAASGDEGEVGWHLDVDMWQTEILDHPDPGPDRICVWVRFHDPAPWSAARLAFVADMIPATIARAAGVNGAGTSLDNSLRLGEIVDTEWVLVDLRAQLAVGGYGHGTVHLWSEDGHLMGIGSQSAAILVLGMSPLRQMPSRQK